MQKAYMTKLLELAEKDGKILHLLADSGTGYDEMFRKNFPNQIYNFGIAENNMVAAAAGLATTGKIPFVYTAGAFLAYRSFEFIRNDICFQNLNVKIVGMGSGFAWSSLGPTHHTTEDLGALRALPNLMILSPATPLQVAQCVQAAYEIEGPVYIKIGMNNEKEFFDESFSLAVAKNELICGTGAIPLYVTGNILEEAVEACEILKSQGIAISVVNISTIKPFDRQNVIEFAKKSNVIFSVEEQSIYGGIGSIISEIIAEEGLGVKVCRIGLQDIFAIGYGSQKDVRKANGLDAKAIARKIMESVEK